MIVFPAIDLKGGDVVRLAEGDMDRATVYGDDPSAQARLFADAGDTFPMSWSTICITWESKHFFEGGVPFGPLPGWVKCFICHGLENGELRSVTFAENRNLGNFIRLGPFTENLKFMPKGRQIRLLDKLSNFAKRSN